MAIIVAGYYSKDTVQIRISPECSEHTWTKDKRKKYLGYDGDHSKFVDEIREKRDKIYSEQNIKRKLSMRGATELQYIFWRIRNDPYVNN